jgi:hypothetical protein
VAKSQQFDPALIPRFSVIRIPYKFDGNRTEKFFVLICHRGVNAICIKATSKVEIYKNNPNMMKSCIYYAAGEVKCFPLETVVQPDNQFPISHADLGKAFMERTLEIHPPLPNFEHELRRVIRESDTLDDRRRERLLAAIG